MEIYNTDSFEVEYKSDNSPVTRADKVAHEIITGGLQRLFPDIPIISEEGDENTSREVLKQPRFWLVDPLDGTQDFVRRTGDFCVAIGLIENNQPSFGVVAAPTFDCVYYGGLATGSFKKVGRREWERISVLPHNPHIAAVSRTRVNEATEKYLAERYPNATLRKIGSMLKQMELAEGNLDIYAVIDQSLHLWDLAAGAAIIEGAGGHVTQPNGARIDYTRSDFLLGDFIARATVDAA